MIGRKTKGDKTSELYVSMVSIGDENILLYLYPILHKIIACNRTEKEKPREMCIDRNV